MNIWWEKNSLTVIERWSNSRLTIEKRWGNVEQKRKIGTLPSIYGDIPSGVSYEEFHVLYENLCAMKNLYFEFFNWEKCIDSSMYLRIFNFSKINTSFHKWLFKIFEGNFYVCCFPIHYSLLSILYSPFSILNSLLSILHSLLSILYSPLSILNSQFSILNSLFSTLHSLFSTLHSLLSVLCYPHPSFYILPL